MDKADLDILCAVPYEGYRQKVLKAIRGGAKGVVVKAQLLRNKAPSSSGSRGRQLIINPGGRVVGAPDFASHEEVEAEEVDGEGDVHDSA